MPSISRRYVRKIKMKSIVTNSDTQVIKDFKKAVTAAKNRREMFWRSQAPDLADMFTQSLEQLKKTVRDPQVGVEALVDFYRRDAEIFERCDDSYGNVGDVFRIAAAGYLLITPANAVSGVSGIGGHIT